MVRSLSIALLLTLGCAPPICDQGSMLDSELGLELTQDEHPEGWAHQDCFGCHAVASLHREGCTPDVDYDALSDLVDEEGQDGCVECHGDNGVAP